MTGINEALRDATGRLARATDAPRLEAELLLAHVLDQSRAWLLARADQRLAQDACRRFAALTGQRVDGQPIAYLTGSREFWSRPFRVTPDALIPRPETEHLIEAVLERLPHTTAARVADLGTGTGVIAITLGLERPHCQVVATDVSPSALALARENATRLGAGNVEFRLADWFQGLEHESFDVIASNPPYIDPADPHLQRGDLRFEPGIALVANEHGLAAIRTIAEQARAHLAPGGWLVIEHGHDQAGMTAGLLKEYGYTAIEGVNDLAGHTRVAIGRHQP